MTICPVILAGGSGSRLWPHSRQHYPKQFLSLFGEQTMLQQTLARLSAGELKIELNASQVICNEAHRFMVVEQAKAMGHALQATILEPTGRNTAPALTISALWQLRSGEDPVLLMMPADHLIQNTAVFQAAVSCAYALAKDEGIVTFGITPDRAETGYGYIEYEAGADADANYQRVKSFTEKPASHIAEEYLAAGNYLWNSGLFMMKASLWLNIIKQVNPAIYSACESAIEQGEHDNDFFWLDKAAFSACPDDSIDYAVMENIGKDNAIQAAVVRLDAGWSDIGSWSSVWEESEKDGQGNVIQGDVLQTNTKNSLIRAHDRLVSVIGAEDLVVVDTADAVMIANKNNSQDVKTLVEQLKASGRKEYENHSLVLRPWGSYETLEMREGFQVKRIIVNPGKRLSLQLHHQRSEHWVVVKGVGTVTLADKVFDFTRK